MLDNNNEIVWDGKLFFVMKSAVSMGLYGEANRFTV